MVLDWIYIILNSIGILIMLVVLGWLVYDKIKGREK